MPASDDRRRRQRRPFAAVLLAGLVAAGVGQASDLPVGGAVAAMARHDARPVSIRVQWGGGTPQAWNGSVTVVAATPGAMPEWRTICTEPDAAAMAHEADGAILVHQPRPVAADGVELSIADWRTARLRVRLAAVAGSQPETTVDVAVADALAGPVQQPLDGDGNRLVIRQASGDALRVTIANATGAPPGQAALRRPGDRVRLRVEPLLPVRTDHAGRYELRVRLLAGLKGETHDAQAVPIVPRESRGAADGDRRLTRCEPLEFEVTLPAREGTCDVELQAVEVGSLRWARPLASRTVQVVAVADRPPDPSPAEWKIVHEVDPGSPRLHERLRRLPGAGLAQVGMPSIPLPAFPRPNVALPNMPLPNMPLPNMPLPNMPLPKLPAVPTVSAMVPRFSGLLVAGHSTVEPHALGPMLLLPPAKAAGEPSWEGVVIAGAQPGIPHAVEIDYPSDQEAVIGASVLELDAVGALVEVRHAGGFEVRRDPYAGGVELRRHRFVFWPTTRNPLVVVSNPSTRRPATIGKVRVLAGPSRLPAPSAPSAVAPTAGRQTFALWPTPDFTAWGGVERVDETTGRGVADWSTHLAAIRHSAEWLSARRATGALVAVYAQGAAIWPSAVTRQAPRWGSGAAAEDGLDPQAKDLLGLLCRVYAGEGLRLVPGMAFDAPLPALETMLAGGGADAVGIVCLGRDGRPRRTSHSQHYNILDARVQQAVEEQVRELAVRLRGMQAVDGVALLMPHDGWLHLPGTATALDDATFARFLDSVGAEEPAAEGDRYARRAELVEGPLRDLWLEWRADAVAAFHARLAAVLAEADPRLVLHIVPTTLFAVGDLATRFRPRLGTDAAAGDVLREAGLDPLRSTAHPQVVFSMPHVHTAADGLLDRGLVAAANLAPAVADAARSARRRGIAIVEQPVSFDARPLASHGPFGAATPAGPCPIHAVPTAAEAGRPLAESLIPADAEIVFDMRLSLAEFAAGDVGTAAFAALPAGQVSAVPDVPAPVVIRMLPQGAGATWMRVINAGAASGRIRIGLDGRPAGVVDVGDRSRIELGTDGVATVPVGPWGVRTLLVDGGVTVRSARMDYDEAVSAVVAARIQDLRRRRAALEMPQPLDVLDNPGFEVGPEVLGAAFADGGRAAAVTGWELVEQRRGSLDLVPGVRPPGAGGGPGRGLAFSSVNGLASLHSNPFPPPPTGRVSVAVWLRIEDGAPQPPLRIAVEGLHDDREYYRFAAVGGLAGGRPLTAEWAQFVLPVDDLPTAGLESLRVRFDLLGPGRVLIDDVRVLDLAFEESQRVQLARLIARFEQSLATRDIGGCVVGLDGHWPRFLAEFVSDAAVARMATVPVPVAAPAAKPAPPAGMLDRVRGWWQ
ncbi:MAG: hypothetical protein LW698_07490 [Planctomycetaceae bacterium]|nr:hypothetical protein [Planctomycetaceae bacterium]